MSSLAVIVPHMPERPDQLLRYAKLVRDGFAARLWQGQATSVDPFHGFAYAAGAGFRVPVGLAVTLMPMKHPFQAAMEARSLATATESHLVYGLGPAPELFQTLVAGAPYPSQLKAVRDYVTAVRGLLDGVPDASTTLYPAGLPLPAMNHPPVSLGLGVLRPRMARLAGELADVAITWLASADYIGATIVPALAAGADPIGRAAPTVSAVVPVALRRRGRNPYRVLLAGSYGHLCAPHYRDMLSRSGITVDPNKPGPAAKELLDHGCFIYGDASEVTEQLEQFAAAGVSEVILNMAGVHAVEGADAAYHEVVEILAALKTSTASARGLDADPIAVGLGTARERVDSRTG